MNWSKYPFIRMVSALALGIAFREIIGPAPMNRFWIAGLLVSLPVVLAVLNRLVKSYRQRWVFGVVTLAAFACMGYVRADLCQSVMEDRNPDFRGDGWRLVRVIEPPKEREKTVKVLLALEGASDKVLAYLQKDENALRLRYGDLVAISGPLEEVSPPKNPEEFNYKQYLWRRGVNWTVYLRSDEWLPTGVARVSPLLAFAYRLRQHLLDALQHCGVTDDEFGVAAAILLGYDESLPAQVRKNFVAAGSMHILCVSGMHVGVIYLLASFLLGLLGGGKTMGKARRLILLLLIWFYALLTGLSPSIMRAALMISFMIIGELIHRKGFTLNSIAASAFVILLINPNNLFAIGFQLSYGAVAGIVLLQKPIYNLVYVRNKWLDKAWEITAVSLSAQIATMPFTVYYFNQFTPYFWLSNLLMTPLSFFVILSGMLLFAVSWIPWINVGVGKIVWFGLRLMNAVVAGVERLPLSLIKGLYMNDLQFALSLLLLLLLWAFVNLRKKRMVMELLAVSVVFSFSLAWRTQQLSRQSEIVVYSLRNHTAISVVQGCDQVFLCDEGLLADVSAIDYSVKAYWAKRLLPMNPRCHTMGEDFSDALVVKRSHLLSAQGRLLAFWTPESFRHDTTSQLPVDYVLVIGKQRPDLQRLSQTYKPRTLLIDGSVPDYQAQEWVRQAKAMNMMCRNIRDGAVFL